MLYSGREIKVIYFNVAVVWLKIFPFIGVYVAYQQWSG
jgi:hypothetical protein